MKPPASVSAAPPGPASAEPAASAVGSLTRGRTRSAPRPEDDENAEARVIDMHVDTPWQVGFKGRSPTLDVGQATPEQLRRGRYRGAFYAIYIADHLHKGRPTIADADEILGTVRKIVAANPDTLFFYDGGPVPEDKVAVHLSIEGAGAFAEDPTQIDRFITAGVRFVGPVHMKDNRLSGSATGKTKGGLSDLGKALAERVYAAGALVDVSHMSDAGFADLVPIAKRHDAPIVATHSNARALADHPRNLSDDQLRAIAASKGVVGINFHGDYLKPGGGASLEDAAAQARYLADVMGVDCVAIGSDFDGANPPPDLADASYLPALGRALEKKGFSARDVRKIFSLNVLRVLDFKGGAPRP